MKLQTTVHFEQLEKSKKRISVHQGGSRSGKCLGLGTKVLMLDGSFKEVQDINVGDNLMGIDSQPRRVMSVIKGREMMYTIKQSRGIDYRVNESHVLSVRHVGKDIYKTIKGVKHYIGREKRDEIINISVKEYLQKTGRWKRQYKGWKVDGVEFEKRDVPLDPYFLGLWLGDGTMGSQNISNIDVEISDYLKEFCNKNNLIYKMLDKVTDTFVYKNNKDKGGGRVNHLRQKLKKIGVFYRKHIPDDYLYNTRESRLQLLAGLIDSDGWMNRGYEIAMKDEGLCRQIQYLARSLGFYSTLRSKISTMKRKDGSIYRCRTYCTSFSCKDYSVIPVKIARKKSVFINNKRDILVSSFEVVKDKIDDYYGFTLDQDGLFILEDFTVTHNTYNILFWFTISLLKSENKVLTVCRKTLPSLKATAYRDFFTIIEKLNMYDKNDHNKSDMTYKIGTNLVEFISLDMPQKVRGRKRNHLFINEANEITIEDWRQLEMRTTEKIVLDFNPSEEFHFIYDEIMTDPNCDFTQTTYMDNPFLEESIVKTIESYKKKDPNYWRVYGLGERGMSEATIFRNWELTGDYDDIEAREEIHGLDFGYNDPTASVSVKLVDKKIPEIYIKQHLFKTQLTSNEITDRMKEIVNSSSDKIYGDCARPEIIEDLRRAGLNIFRSEKGKNSVKDSIDYLKHYKLMIDKGSLDLIKEMRMYKWKVHSNGRVLEEPVDLNNHLIDALRYACFHKKEAFGYSFV